MRNGIFEYCRVVRSYYMVYQDIDSHILELGVAATKDFVVRNAFAFYCSLRNPRENRYGELSQARP